MSRRRQSHRNLSSGEENRPFEDYFGGGEYISHYEFVDLISNSRFSSMKLLIDVFSG